MNKKGIIEGKIWKNLVKRDKKREKFKNPHKMENEHIFVNWKQSHD